MTNTFAEWLRRIVPANFAASRSPPHPRFVLRLVVAGTEMEQSSTLQGAAEARAAELLLPEDISTPDTSPKTPPARSRICSEAEEEGAAKMVRVSTGSELTRVSPSRLRMIARSRLKLPPFVSQVNLPLLDVVTAASFLAWHAGKLVLFHNLREVRTRKTRKIGLTTEDIIVALAGNSQAEVPGRLIHGEIGWASVMPCPESSQMRISSAECRPAVTGRSCGTPPRPWFVRTGVTFCRPMHTEVCRRRRQCQLRMERRCLARSAAVAR